MKGGRRVAGARAHRAAATRVGGTRKCAGTPMRTSNCIQGARETGATRRVSVGLSRVPQASPTGAHVLKEGATACMEGHAGEEARARLGGAWEGGASDVSGACGVWSH